MSLRTRLLLALGYLVALVTIAFAVPLALNIRDRAGEEVREGARTQIGVLAAGASEPVVQRSVRDLGVLARASARAAGGRVVIVDDRGGVLADSEGAAARGTDYATLQRPELQAALRGERVQTERASDTLAEDILASAEPVYRSGRVVGAVRLTQSVSAVNDRVNRTMLGILAVGLAVLLVALVVAFLLARGIALPITRLDDVAQRVAAGDLDARAPVQGSREQRSLGESFNAMTERLGRTVRAQKEFAADASHQLRTPLTGLRLRLEEARAVAGDRAALEHELDAGLREVDRIAQTVDELLVLSRTGERDAPGELLDPAETARAAGRRWTPTAATHELTLQVQTTAPTQAVWCARADLDRALDAVIENAILYGAGGRLITIRAAGSAIEVLDEGAGLAPGEEQALFERFKRGSAGAAAPNGTGLGLAIARELMRCWNGDAQLSNRDGRGAQATLTLPAFTGSLPSD
ncbi:MAG TPA: ATP-binding protein [Solirubrobacteraceae bacterium]|nr:ATP-binding protein [Solirubrobacteraceae bacterium]